MKDFYARTSGIILAACYFLYCASTPMDWHFIDWPDLIFHEAGHTIFIFFGQFIHVLMGSGFQVLLPLLITGYFFYTRQLLSASVTLMWAGYNLVNVSVYASDAVVMQLPLLGGDTSGHDWHYLLSSLNVLEYTPAIGHTIDLLGWAVIFAGLLCGLYFLSKEQVLANDKKGV